MGAPMAGSPWNKLTDFHNTIMHWSFKLAVDFGPWINRHLLGLYNPEW